MKRRIACNTEAETDAVEYVRVVTREGNVSVMLYSMFGIEMSTSIFLPDVDRIEKETDKDGRSKHQNC